MEQFGDVFDRTALADRHGEGHAIHRDDYRSVEGLRQLDDHVGHCLRNRHSRENRIESSQRHWLASRDVGRVNVVDPRLAQIEGKRGGTDLRHGHHEDGGARHAAIEHPVPAWRIRKIPDLLGVSETGG